MSTPDLTPAQLTSAVAALGAVIAILATAPDRLQVPLLVVLGVIAVAWIVADAIIRHGRAAVAVEQVKAGAERDA